MLNPALVERVLDRLGFAAPPTTNLAGLSSLYRAWCERVPFDNIQKRLHIARGDTRPLPGDQPAEFFASWLGDGTGGTCWAGNGGLCELLAAIGFDARRGMGTMLVAPDLPPNHATVVVTAEGARYLVDASMLFLEPLPLRADAPATIDHPAAGVTVTMRDGHFVVAWRPLHTGSLDCRIDTLESNADDYRTFHEATRPWSPFNFQLSLRTMRDGAVVGAGLGQFAGITAEGQWWIRPFAPGERVRFLIDTVGIREEVAMQLPDDVPMPPPPKR